MATSKLETLGSAASMFILQPTVTSRVELGHLLQRVEVQESMPWELTRSSSTAHLHLLLITRLGLGLT